ncbi:MAG: hypothetical protein RL199_1235 [Pseudomonadota bacterium]
MRRAVPETRFPFDGAWRRLVVLAGVVLAAVTAAGGKQVLAATRSEASRWEDVSFGTGETEFTAVAVDPENVRRLYAGGGGTLFVSVDGGVVWSRAIDLRGGRSTAKPAQSDSSERELENEVEDRVQELREEALEEARREIADELGLVDEAAAEDLAEERVDEEEDRLRDEARAEVAARRRTEGTNASVADQARLFSEQSQSLSPRRIIRIETAPGGRVLAATTSSLHVSEDRGVTFREINVGQGNSDLEVRAAIWGPGRTLFAGTPSGLFRSDDAGGQWGPITDLPPSTPVNDLDVDPTDGKAVLAASEFGVYRSDDGGTFVPVLQPGSPLGLLVRAVSFDRRNPGRAYAGTMEGLYRSDDSGLTWRRLEPEGLLSRETTDLSASPWGVVVATVAGVFVSEDGGEVFHAWTEGLEERDIRRVATGPGAGDLWAASARGLYAWSSTRDRVRRGRTLADLQRALSLEPSFDDLRAGLLAAFSLDESPRALMRRVGLAGWAPRLTLRYSAKNPLNDGFSTRFVSPVDAPDDQSIYDTRASTGTFQALALWDAQRVVFNPDALGVATVNRRQERFRERLLRRLASTYDAHHRAMTELYLSPPESLPLLAKKVLHMDELVGTLDLLTNGTYSVARATMARERNSAPRIR